MHYGSYFYFLVPDFFFNILLLVAEYYLIFIFNFFFNEMFWLSTQLYRNCS